MPGVSKLAVHFSSKSDDWSTPQDLFDSLNKEFGPFHLDPCANSGNTKCDRYFDKQTDGLKQDWSYSRVFMNPPYGREIGKWVKKAYEERLKGSVIVCLLPARTDTKWFHEYCMKGEVRFLKGRLKFGGHKNPAPFPSMIVVFK